QRLLDRMVGRERGVAQRRGFGRVQSSQRHQQPRRWHQHVLGHAAIGPQPAAVARDRRVVLAVVFRRPLAGAAAAAAPGAVHGDRIAFLPALYAAAQGGDPAGVLVAQGERPLETQALLEHVQVGMADAGAADLQQHLARAGPRLGQIDHFGRPAGGDEADGFHGDSRRRIRCPTMRQCTGRRRNGASLHREKVAAASTLRCSGSPILCDGILARRSPRAFATSCPGAHMRIRLAAVLGLLLAACQPASNTGLAAPGDAPAGAAPQPTVVDAAHIDQVLQGIVDEGRAVGVSDLVHESGREAYFSAFGMTDREAARPMARDTLAQVYSMTKPVTGVVLMSLYEQGLFELDEPLATYLPEYANVRVHAGDDADGKPILVAPERPILVRDILRHTAGFTAAF